MSDDQSPTRKASEILLDLENDVKTLLSIVKSQELNIRVLSNKLNTVMEKLDKQTTVAAPSVPVFRVEAVGAKMPNVPPPPSFTPPATEDKQVPIFSDFKIPMTNEPEGFRRTSRPETYSGDNAYLVKPNTPMEALKFPPQQNQNQKPPPGRMPSEVIVPPKANKIEVPPTPPPTPVVAQPQMNQNAVPVQQRVVNKEGKSVFLADVEIIDHQTAQPVFKTRTNGAGKWMASLAPGNYRVTINKRESMTKQKVEVVQDIQVDGSKSPYDLQTIIIK